MGIDPRARRAKIHPPRDFTLEPPGPARKLRPPLADKASVAPPAPMLPMLTRLSITVLLGLCSACLVNPSGDATDQDASARNDAPIPQYWHTFQPDLPTSQPPFTEVHANWKQRIDQPYVYVEFVGSYTETGRLLPMVHQSMLEQGLEPIGPPFALYYDDPGQTPVESLRSRACVPVADRVTPASGLAFDLLPSTTVVYAFASGPYPEVPRAYAGMYDYMEANSWIENGPIRETYLVSPGAVTTFDELLTEVQIPVTFAR